MNKLNFAGSAFVLVLVLSSSFLALAETYNSDYQVYGSSVNPQFTSPGSSYYSSSYYSPYSSSINRQCYSQQDFVLTVPAGGCSPTFVRSDLLEEQNVPVFCKLVAVGSSPISEVSKIRSVRFSGDYPKGISGLSYYPSRRALKNSFTDITNDAGYLVVTVSRQGVEGEMPDVIRSQISAIIDYESEGSFGVGKTYFYLSETDESEWSRDYKNYGFWNGRWYVRADSIENNEVKLSVYTDSNSKQSTFTLKKGESSSDISSGSSCEAGFSIKLEDINTPVNSALLQINDEQMWVAKGDRIIDDKCRVSELIVSSLSAKVSITCPVKDGKFDLVLNPNKARFIVDDKNKTVSVGKQIREGVYLAYIGKDSESQDYAILVKDSYSASEKEFGEKGTYSVVNRIVSDGKPIDSLKDRIKSSIIDQYKTVLHLDSVSNLEVIIIKEGEIGSGFILDSVSLLTDKDWSSSELTDSEELGFDYYSRSTSEYEDLVELYPGERMLDSEDPYAAQGLYEAAQISKRYEMNEKAQEFYNNLVKDYPDSNVAKQAMREVNLMLGYDTSNSKAVVNMNNQQYFIDLVDFRKPEEKKLNAVFLIGGKESKLGLNEVKLLKQDSNSSYTMQLSEIKSNYVAVEFGKSGDKNSKSVKLDLDKNKQFNFNGVDVQLTAVNIDKQAKISIVPEESNRRTESVFNLEIYVEKRAIQLTPEMAKLMMDGLISTIQMWTAINDNLGNLIRVMKAACFTTSSVMTTKSSLSSGSGESVARNWIMTKGAGWNDYCEKEVNEGRYSSVYNCLNDKSKEVEGDVSIYSKELDRFNDLDKEDMKEYNSKVDEMFQEFCKNAQGSVVLPDKSKSEVNFEGENGVCNMKGLSSDQKKQIISLYNSKDSGSFILKNVTREELGKVVLEGKNYDEFNSASIKAQQNDKTYNLGVDTTEPSGEKVAYGDVRIIKKGDSGHSIYGTNNFKEGDRVIRVLIPAKKYYNGGVFEANPEVAGKEVIVEVKETEGSSGNYNPSGRIYSLEGREIVGNASNSVKEYLSLAGINSIRQADQKAYQNKMKNPDQLYVSYFEKAPYKGLPSLVPFDVDKGWYVASSYVLSGFGKPYDESGRIVNYYICNVGENGLIEFKKSGDDICRYYNADTGAAVDFPGMSSEESRQLVSKAEKAVKEAAGQYGKDRITINGRTFKSGKSFGGEEGRCTDFMSVQDCQVLFNSCDPVICPASRCDLGGKYRVDNVIQSGVIGSLVLCLPNYKEGIMVPICLTGVHAGIESYISILNSSVDCLRESIETGKNIGICDEIKSVYICDLFFSQAFPLLDVFVPGLGGLTGTRGGGEYLNTVGAMQNTQSAVDYFNGVYASQSVSAFNSRSREGIGSGLCTSFVSAGSSYGNFSLGNLFNSFNLMLEPDSPVQYNAWFSENVMTTATVPPTSHYKVYYHIYAGKDQGSSYVVYLKDIDIQAGIHSAGSFVVDRGYIARGSQVDQARDFTASSGFKQLCISINGREECGFGKVSTSYALNILTDQYAEEQLEQEITSEAECVAGTPSSVDVVPNLGTNSVDAQRTILYNQGIIRVCSSENPGIQLTSQGEYDRNSNNSRWKEVGYCGDTTVKCWLDTNSVKDVIQNSNLEKQILDSVNTSTIGEGYWTEEKSREVARDAEDFIEELSVRGKDRSTVVSYIQKTETNLEQLRDLGYNNVQRARGAFLLARMYKKVAEGLRPNYTDVGELGVVSDIPEKELLITLDSSDSAETKEEDSEDKITEGEEAESNKENGSENSVSENVSESSKEVVFEFQDGTAFENVFYKYDRERGWIFSFGLTENFKSSETFQVSNPKDQAFVKSIQGKGYEEGVKLLLIRVLQKNEGGWFASPSIVIYMDGESESYSPDDLLLTEPGKFIERIA